MQRYQVTSSKLDRAEHQHPSAGRRNLHHFVERDLGQSSGLQYDPRVCLLYTSEAAWAQCDELGYQELPTEHSLAVFGAVRTASLDVLRRLGDQDLERYREHSESGRYTLRMWLDIYTEHPRAHAAQLVEAVNA